MPLQKEMNPHLGVSKMSFIHRQYKTTTTDS